VTVEELRTALVRAGGAAVPTCLALLDDATTRVDGADRPPTTTAHVATIYRRRASHVARIGLPTLGFDEAAQQLTATEHRTLRLIGIEAAGGHPSCVVFLAPDEPTVIASLAVLGPVPPA